MSGRQSTGAGSVWQIWNVVSVVLAAAAGLLLAAGYTIAGAIAFVICAGGYAARRRAVRK